MTNTLKDATQAVKVLRPFISIPQLNVLGNACRGEERQYFKDTLVEMADLVSTMPETYGQDGKGDQAIVYLHYFIGGSDWYITEKDSDPDGEGQIQAFGWVDLGYGGELGYISITELIANNVELDLHWTPKTLGVIKLEAA